MIKFHTLCFFLWLTAGLCRSVTVSEIVDGVSAGSYSNRLGEVYTSYGDSRGFTHGESPRTPLPQHDLARDLMVSNFQASGFDTWLDPFYFDHAGVRYTNCNNVVAVKWGQGGTNIYIIGGHYDSVDLGDSTAPGLTNACPGADDNGSGIAAMLEAARVIKDYTFRDTIMFVAFDAEEKDYRGSIHFVREHITDQVAATSATTFLKSSIKGMVNVETIFYDDPDTPPYVVMGTVSGSNLVAMALAQAVADYTSLLPYYASGYDSSDHKIFQAAGIDSIHLIEYDFKDYWGVGLVENPYYHTDGDAIDSPGYVACEYAAEVTKAVVGAICDHAGIIMPATLDPSTTGSGTFKISWTGTPDVAYSLYETTALSMTSSWGWVQDFPAAATTEIYSVELNADGAGQTFFRVHSR